MTAKNLKHAVYGFVGSVVLGACLFGVPCGLYGAIQASGPRGFIEKNGSEVPMVEHAAESFLGGAVLGGAAGTIAGLGVAIKRLVS